MVTTVAVADRAPALKHLREPKMARSAHAYVRGATRHFYEWLAASPVAAASASCPAAPALAAHVDVAGTTATFVARPEGRLDAALIARTFRGSGRAADEAGPVLGHGAKVVGSAAARGEARFAALVPIAAMPVPTPCHRAPCIPGFAGWCARLMAAD